MKPTFTPEFILSDFALFPENPKFNFLLDGLTNKIVASVVCFLLLNFTIRVTQKYKGRR